MTATERAWAIVRRLAESTPLERIGSAGIVRCWYCGKLEDYHTADCLWREAREVIDANVR